MTRPINVAALRGLILAVLLAALELAASDAEPSWRTLVVAFGGALYRWLGEGGWDQHHQTEGT